MQKFLNMKIKSYNLFFQFRNQKDLFHNILTTFNFDPHLIYD